MRKAFRTLEPASYGLGDGDPLHIVARGGSADGQVIATTYPRGPDIGPKELEALTHKMAAAPEMLAALDGVLAALSQPKTFPADVELAKSYARAAIAKARGDR